LLKNGLPLNDKIKANALVLSIQKDFKEAE